MELFSTTDGSGVEQLSENIHLKLLKTDTVHLESAVPVTVDDVGAGLLPKALQVFELSEGLVPQLLISALQKVLRCHQSHVHLHSTFMLRLVDFLHREEHRSQCNMETEPEPCSDQLSPLWGLMIAGVRGERSNSK